VASAQARGRYLIGLPGMSSADPQPRRPELPSELHAGELAALEHDAAIAEVELSRSQLPDQRANGVSFDSARLAGVDLSGSRLEHLSIVNAVLTGCNLANIHGNSARLARVDIQSSRLTGTVLADATLSDVTLLGCRADLASFGFSRLQRVTFEDCLLTQADFLDARLHSVRFHDCDLSRADFRGAQLKNCEFRRCQLTEVDGVTSLRGASLEWPAIVELAGTWAGALGIQVLDDEGRGES
jgi:uncharacterized protein YjbI with pentapeptide repeats